MVFSHDPLLSCGHSIFISFINFDLSLPLQWGGDFSSNALSPILILLSTNRLSVIHNKDVLATIHLLVAMVKHFQPELNLPPNVKVEVVVVEVSSTLIFRTFACQSKHTCAAVKSILFHLRLQVSGSGIKSHTEMEVLTDDRWAEYRSVPRRGSFQEAHIACFWTETAATPLAAFRVSKEASPIWHVDYQQCKIAAWSDYSRYLFSPEEDPIDQLLKLEAHKVNTVKQV